MKLAELCENTPPRSRSPGDHVGSDLRALVHSALDNAMGNGYKKQLVRNSVAEIANDLVSFDSDLEKHPVKDLLPHITSWIEKNRADLKEGMSPEERVRILKMGFRHGLAGEKLPNVAGVKSSDMKISHGAYEAGKKLRDKLGADNIPPFKNEAGKQHREFDNFANKHFDRLGLVNEARDKHPARVLIWTSHEDADRADAEIKSLTKKIGGAVGQQHSSGHQMTFSVFINNDKAQKLHDALLKLDFVEKVVVNYEYEG